ncbi:MAG: RNA-binding protein [Proteobacteria bacterium]|nr:RNA-binding protein [Pseudomonadota bacterium]MBU1717240.1 RNA-binding protein [Pseudomonadota bacterium]
MNKVLYIGNLPFSSSEDEIRGILEIHGTVHSIKLINDRQTGKPRGFGFIEMDDLGAISAINALNNQEFGGRNLRVNEAREKIKPRKTK